MSNPTHKILAAYTDRNGVARVLRIGSGRARPDGSIGLVFDILPPPGANTTLVPL